MKNNGRWFLLPILCLALALASSCAKKAEDTSTTASTTEAIPTPSVVTVTAVDLGKSVGSDKRISDPTKDFTPQDVVYATILTSGAAPNAVLKAKWTFQDGQVIDETEQVIAPTGDAATEFHVAKPDGWPAGKYKLEVFLDGQPVKTVEYEVKA